MEAHDVHAGFGQAAGDFFRIVKFRETGAAIEVHAPKAGGRTVFKGEVAAACFHEAMLASGLFLAEYEGNVHGHVVVIRGERDVA